MENMHAILAAIAVIAVLGAAYVIFSVISTASLSSNVFISLTDPANVPVGTTSLNITYNSLAVHEVSGNSSGWVSVPGSGELNLMALQNFTQTLGSVSLSNGSKINIIRFNVTAASITLNGTVYPVVLATSRISVNTQSEVSVNGTTNLLVDINPTVVTILTANSTVFLLVPSLRAVRLPANASHAVGVRHRLDEVEHRILDMVRPNLSITNPVLSVSGNVTHLSLTVTDNSNQSVVLQHVGLKGMGSVHINTTEVSDLNETIHNRINVSGNQSGRSRGNETPSIRTDTLANDNVSHLGHNTTLTITEITREQEQLVHESHVLNFFVSSNGTMFLPFEHEAVSTVATTDCSSAPVEVGDNVTAGSFAACSFGYALQAHQSVTLSFTGKITMGFGRVVIVPISGNSYELGVQGTLGARAVTNVSAT